MKISTQPLLDNVKEIKIGKNSLIIDFTNEQVSILLDGTELAYRLNNNESDVGIDPAYYDAAQKALDSYVRNSTWYGKQLAEFVKLAPQEEKQLLIRAGKDIPAGLLFLTAIASSFSAAPIQASPVIIYSAMTGVFIFNLNGARRYSGLEKTYSSAVTTVLGLASGAVPAALTYMGTINFGIPIEAAVPITIANFLLSGLLAAAGLRIVGPNLKKTWHAYHAPVLFKLFIMTLQVYISVSFSFGRINSLAIFLPIKNKAIALIPATLMQAPEAAMMLSARASLYQEIYDAIDARQFKPDSLLSLVCKLAALSVAYSFYSIFSELTDGAMEYQTDNYSTIRQVMTIGAGLGGATLVVNGGATLEEMTKYFVGGAVTMGKKLLSYMLSLPCRKPLDNETLSTNRYRLGNDSNPSLNTNSENQSYCCIS